MSSWPDDLRTFSLKQLVALRDENKVWNQELRYTIAALVNRKLSKQISSQEYAVQRGQVNEQLAECQRRGAVLVEEILYRERQRPGCPGLLA